MPQLRLQPPLGLNPAQPKPYKVCNLIIGLSAVEFKGDSTVTCHSCSVRCSRYGKDRKGNQRYRCSQCNRTFSEPQEKPLDEMTLDLQKAEMCLRLLLEGCSIRSVERVTGVHRDTIIRLLVKAGERCERLLSERIRGLEVDEVQADEIWGFVGMKEKRRPEDREDLGDAWAFVAFERKTKMVLCYHLGKRTMADTQIFTDRLADATRGNFQITTDGFAPYVKAIDESLGQRVSFAQLIKVYRASAEAERRYSPAECVEAVPVERIGMPVKEKICTSHVERNNLTMRMHLRRLTRLTNGFSKKWANLNAALALFFAYYNFCRVHRTIRVTPAMESGMADHIWTIGELLR
jgi:transposase-like protein/IS1 family transposase